MPPTPTPPEDLPLPERLAKQLEAERQRRHIVGDEIGATNLGGSDPEIRRAAEAYDQLAKVGAISPERALAEITSHLAEPGQSERERLYSYAVAHKRLVPMRDARKLQALEDRGQSEHEVYFVPSQDKVIKVTHAGKYGISHTLENYLTRMVQLNQLAPGLDIKFIGFTPDADTLFPQAITEMKYVEGAHPDPAELHHALIKKYGFALVNRASHHYRHTAAGVEIIDGHNGNFLRTPEGEYVPIDINVDGDAGRPIFSREL